jgi:hypothetical protein
MSFGVPIGLLLEGIIGVGMGWCVDLDQVGLKLYLPRNVCPKLISCAIANQILLEGDYSCALIHGGTRNWVKLMRTGKCQ